MIPFYKNGDCKFNFLSQNLKSIPHPELVSEPAPISIGGLS